MSSVVKGSRRGSESSDGVDGKIGSDSRAVVGLDCWDFDAGDGEDGGALFRRLLRRAERSVSGVEALGEMGLGLGGDDQRVM